MCVMRTSTLRGAAVVAGFAGVSLLVAGTATAMMAGSVEAPVATAVRLTHEDPISQTAPVSAEVQAPGPVEVGSAAIKCDDDGTCSSRITVNPTSGDAPEDTSSESVSANSDNPQRSQEATGESDPPANDELAPDPPPSDRHETGRGHGGPKARDHERSTPPHRGPGDGAHPRDFDLWEAQRWSPSVDENWRDDFLERWAERTENTWNPTDWFEEGWQARPPTGDS